MSLPIDYYTRTAPDGLSQADRDFGRHEEDWRLLLDCGPALGITAFLDAASADVDEESGHSFGDVAIRVRQVDLGRPEHFVEQVERFAEFLRRRLAAYANAKKARTDERA